MFGIGTPELLVILAVALIVIGPKKLPDLAKSLGRALGEFKRATNDLKQNLEQESGLDEVREHFRGARQDALSSMRAGRKQQSGLSDSTPSPADHAALPAATGTNVPATANPDTPSEANSGPSSHPDGDHGVDTGIKAQPADDQEKS